MRRKIFAYFLIFTVFFATHLSYIPNGFTWLDHGDIEQKVAIRSVFSPVNIFFEPYAATNFYRPVLTLFLSLNYLLFQTNPTGYHITNLILMVLIVLISPIFLSKFVPLSSKEKLIVAFLMCVHPLTWLSTGSISYRPELLVILFSEIFVIFHIKYRESKGLIFCYLSLVFLLLALFSKETAFVLLPLLILIYEWRQKKKTTIPYLYFLEEILAILTFIVLRYGAVGNIWSTRSYSMNIYEQIGTRILVIDKLLLMIITPLLPSFSDATRIVSIFDIKALTSLVIICLLIYLGIKSKNTQVKVGVLLTLITLSPAFNIFALPRFISPHYALFSMITAQLILIGIYRMLSKKKKIAFNIIAVSIYILMSYQIYTGGFRFKNDFTLFYPDVSKDNHFLEGHYYLGDYYFSQNNIKMAGQEYENSLAVDKKIISYIDKTSAQIKLANIKRIQKKYDEAYRLLNSAAENKSPYVQQVISYDRAVIDFESKK